MADKGTEVTIAETTDIIPFQNFETIQNMGAVFFKSGMFSDIKSAAQAVVKIAAGRELGLSPIFSMQNINLIRDRLTTSANTMAMLVKKSGRYNYRITEHTDDACAIDFYEIDDGKWVLVGGSKFTIDDAKRADLVKPGGGWVKYPRAMLFSRAISQGARIYAPDAIGGIYTDEEIRSIPAMPNDSVKTTEEEVVEGEFRTKPDSTAPQPEPEAVETISSPVAKEKSSKAPTEFTPLKNVGELLNRAAGYGISSKAVFEAVAEGTQSPVTKASDIKGLEEAWAFVLVKFAGTIRAYNDATK